MPESPLVAGRHTNSEKASSELSLWSRVVTSIGKNWVAAALKLRVREVITFE